ncbi:POM152 [Candida oxycetoniae]|uniref:POM152 n=1 Tax=Candida oxycetoniae TaxID=497107 RepID=A0AAI9WVX1_9ASCO|nr:POM152 [Candida oxycetoniae]KAI3402391.2 POM152 [Candida oxycetoniae]
MVQRYETNRRFRRRSRERDFPKPLISTKVLDAASQRIFVFSVFILLQSWKIYDLVLLKSDLASTSLSSFTFILKYAVIDGTFLWLLPILKIPHINFSPLQTIVCILLMNGISMFLVSSWAVPLLSYIVLPVWKVLLQKKELNIVGESITRANAIDMDSHFKGQLTIKYLPDSSAKMNPFHIDQTCLGSENGFEIEMPVEFNTTSGIGFLQVQQTTPNNEIKLHNYTGHALNKLFRKNNLHLNKLGGDSKNKNKNKNSNNIFYAQFPIREPGFYRLKNVLDKKGNSIRMYKSEFMIAECPSARFYYPPHFDKSKTFMCLSSLEEKTFPIPWLEVSGPPQLFVALEIRVNGNDFKSFNISISQDADNSKDRLKTDFGYLRTVKLLRNSLEPIVLQNSHPKDLGADTVIEFHLKSVSDIFGNIHRYQPLSKDLDVWFRLNLRKSPTIGLFDPNPEKQLIINGTKALGISHMDQFKASDFPIEITVAATTTTNNRSNFTQKFNSVSAMQRGISISQPGSYQLLNAHDAFCPCEIANVSSVEVELATPPNLDIIAVPVSDKCLGVVGYKFDFNLTGKAPFKVQYQIYSNNSGILRPIVSDSGKKMREILSHQNSYSFEFRPPSEGSYTIIFKNIRDANYYQRPIPVNETIFSYQTYFRQASEIFLKPSSRTLYTCYGESASIPVDFKGNDPFSFAFDFIDPQSKKNLIKSTHEDNVIGNFVIRTPPSLIGKTYEVVLRDAKDKYGCNVRILNQNKPVRVVSRPDIPEVRLKQPNEQLMIVEGGHVEVPLDYKSSIGPHVKDFIDMKYLPVDANHTQIKRASIKGSSIQLSQAGTYWLHSFENNGCKGKIADSERKVTLFYHEKPSLAIVPGNEYLQHRDDSTIHLKPVCIGCENEIKLSLKGKAPFVIDYEIKLPSGKIESRSMSIEGDSIKVKLLTKENGLYEHTFKRIYDSIYTKGKGIVVETNTPKVLYKVNALPKVQFLSDKHFSQICENKLNMGESLCNIPVKFFGEYPFDIDVLVKNEETGNTQLLHFKNIIESHFALKSMDFFTLGDYSISLIKVTDGNGCTSEVESNLKYILSIMEPPNIVKSDPSRSHYCVGDHVAYNLTGAAPIKVFYEYNNVERKAEVNHRFERLASKPGVLHIKNLVDSGENQCMVDYTTSLDKFNSLSLEVHELPSVEVNKGDYIIEDLHEGDQTELIFTFVGEPPFQLTYIRTIEVKRGHKKVKKLLEKESVSDILEREYTVLASLEGTYEAIEVSDKYCRAVKTVSYIE